MRISDGLGMASRRVFRWRNEPLRNRFLRFVRDFTGEFATQQEPNTFVSQGPLSGHQSQCPSLFGFSWQKCPVALGYSARRPRSNATAKVAKDRSNVANSTDSALFASSVQTGAFATISEPARGRSAISTPSVLKSTDRSNSIRSGTRSEKGA